MPVVLLLLHLSTTHNYLCGSRILYQCCCCCFLLRVRATWSHGEVTDSNSLPKRKGRREKVNVKNGKEKKKRSIEKDSHVYIYSLTEQIGIAAPKDNITISSPLSLLLVQPLPCLSNLLRRTGNKVTFSLAKRKADAQNFWLALACRQDTLNLQCMHFP